MKFTKYIAAACVAALLGLTAVAAFGQDGKFKFKGDKVKHKEFCTSTWSNDEKASFDDLREQTIAASGSIDVDVARAQSLGDPDIKRLAFPLFKETNNK